MHATYTFILDNDDEHDDLTDPESAKEQFQSLASSFDGQYGDEICDENNWHTVFGAVLKDGTLLGNPEFIARWTEDHPDPGTRFDAAVRFSAGCVAVNMDLFGGTRIAIPGMEKTDEDRELDAMTTEQVVEGIYERAPRKLSEAYANFTRLTPVGQGFDMDGYKRAQLAQQFEKFHDAGFKPFTDYGTPYEYRAFDIRNEGKGEEPSDDDVILFVDIHT